MTENPLLHLQKWNPAIGRKRNRGAFTENELSRLLAAAESGSAFHGMSGGVRSLLYQTAIYSGYRWSELRSLTKANFDFEACTVSLQAENAKNEQNATNPLPDVLTRALTKHAKLFLPSAMMFTGMWKDKGAEMIRHDMKAAEIPERDEAGQSRDFHSLRHSLSTMLARHGFGLAVAQRIMRHSDPKLTMNVYGHLRIEDKAKELAKLPFVTPATGPEAEAAKATGTDGKLAEGNIVAHENGTEIRSTRSFESS